MSYGQQAVIMVTGLWLVPFYLNHIGQHDFGLWLVGTQLLTYLTLTDFGVVALVPLETAYATGRAGGAQSAQDLPQIVGQTVRLVLYQLPIVALIAAGMWLTIPKEWESLRGPLTVVLIGFVVSFPLRMLPALLHGLQDLSFAGAISMVNWTLSTVITVWMVLGGWDLYALAVGWLLSQTATIPIVVHRLVTRFPGVLPRRLPPESWAATKGRLGKGFWVSLAQVAQLLMNNTDLLILGKLLGPAAVVPYSCTGKVPAVLGNQMGILMQSATPGLCELKTGESREKLFQVLVALTHGILTFSGLVFCVVAVVNKWFVTWWVTGHQYGGMTLTVALLAMMVVRHWTTLTAYSVFCFGHQRRISLTNLADGVVTAGSCWSMTLLMGPVGAPIGSIMGAVLVSLPWNLWRMAQDTDASVGRLVLAMLGSWSWRFAPAAALSLWVAWRWSPRNLIEAGAAGLAITLIYGALMFPNVMRSPLGNYLRALAAAFRGKYAALQMRFSS